MMNANNKMMSASPNSKQPQKKRKDPNAPKRASNAYMIFCKERRARLKQERPDLPFGKVGAQLGDIWRQMSAEEKKPYEDRAASDRERYKQELEKYQHSSNDGPKDSKKLKVDPIGKKKDSMVKPDPQNWSGGSSPGGAPSSSAPVVPKVEVQMQSSGPASGPSEFPNEYLNMGGSDPSSGGAQFNERP